VTIRLIACVMFQRPANGLDLSTRPLKSEGKLRERFEAEHGTTGAVELDAINPDTLRELVRAAIERHIDFRTFDTLRTAESNERRMLEMFATPGRRPRPGRTPTPEETEP
jgi:hypothetical protein